MSTAGKVLVVIVALTTLVWILLMAKVADLHGNWNAEVQRQRDAVVKAEAEHVRANADLARKKDDIDREQNLMEKETMVLRRLVSSAERAHTEASEALHRVNFQLESVNAQVKNAQEIAAQRLKERTDTEEAIAKGRQSINEMKARNDALLAELTDLRNQFTRTLAENKQLLEQVARNTNRRVRPASMPAPAR